MFMPTVRTFTKLTALASVMLLLGACNKAADTAATTAAAPAPAAACDRACLISATDAYIAALVAHDPTKAPLADKVVFVENVTRMQPGEGLWKTVVKGPSTFAIHVPDATNHSVGYLAMMTYLGPAAAPQGSSPEVRVAFAANNPPVEQPVVVAMRLKFDDNGKIIEAEHLLAGVNAERQLAELQTPREGLLADVPAESRKSHDDLITIGKSYYDALDDNNGELMPFAPDCERHENGMITASGKPAPDAPAVPGTPPAPKRARDCRGQLNSGTFQYIAHIENRRVFAADPQTGLVMGLSHFRHPMDNLPYDVKNLDGTTSQMTKETMKFAPFDLPAGHIFKIGADGMVHEIEAMGFTTTYNSPTGWE